MEKEEIQHITVNYAKENDIYIKITNDDTKKTIIKKITNHPSEILVIKARTGEHFIIEKQVSDLMAAFDINTHEKLDEFFTQNKLADYLMIDNRNYREISNGSISVFIDEYNLQYMDNQAIYYKEHYADKQIDDKIKITGNQFYNTIKYYHEIIDKIMSGNINILDNIPLRKNGTFQKNRRIPIATANVSDGATYDDYPTKSELALTLTTYDMYYNYGADILKPTNETHARLSIIYLDGAKKLIPLINKNGTITNLALKTQYLKQTDVKPGSVYKEKSGTAYLYIGKINCIKLPEINDTNYHEKCHVHPSRHHYIRYTKKIQEMTNAYPTLDKLLSAIFKAHTYDPFSTRIEPRKFVSFEETVYADDTDNYASITLIPPDVTIELGCFKTAFTRDNKNYAIAMESEIDD